MRKHTPGPWTATPWSQDGPAEIAIHGADGTWIADVVYDQDSERELTEEMQANAALIAAAPELLDAIEACLRGCWTGARHRKSDPLLAQVKAAISKAKGGAE